MYLALFLVALLFLYGIRATKQPFYQYGVFMAIIALFPLTQIVLRAYFQNFYGNNHFVWLLPIMPVVAFTTILVYEKLWDKWKKRSMMPIVCILIALCGCMLADGSEAKATSNHSQEEIEEIYELILLDAEEDGGLIIGPQEIIYHARTYSAKLRTVYGRDLWEQELTPYFYDEYAPYMYQLHQYFEGSLQENESKFLAAIHESGAEYIVFDKESLTFDKTMHYPADIQYEQEMTLEHFDETGHYVIYKRTS